MWLLSIYIVVLFNTMVISTYLIHNIHTLVDLYISMAPLAHPTRENFTWFHSSYGADSLTIQYEDIHRRCHSEPGVDHRSCEFRIGMTCVCGEGWVDG